jgi:hypothetical protein
MSNKHRPDHVDGFTRDAEERFPETTDSFHPHYQIACPCGGTLFRTFLSNCKTVIALCAGCGRAVTIYDLACYPAATKSKGREEFRQVFHPSGEATSEVFVMYEYGELDEDQAFDKNDITWCRIWLKDSTGSRAVMLDDESA